MDILILSIAIIVSAIWNSEMDSIQFKPSQSWFQKDWLPFKGFKFPKWFRATGGNDADTRAYSLSMPGRITSFIQSIGITKYWWNTLIYKERSWWIKYPLSPFNDGWHFCKFMMLQSWLIGYAVIIGVWWLPITGWGLNGLVFNISYDNSLKGLLQGIKLVLDIFKQENNKGI